MLIDKFPGTSSELDLREVLEQRVQYLVQRASAVAERQPDRDEPRWRGRMILASLWMEAAEGAAALKQISETRRCLSEAARSLLQLGLPLGAALQRAFKLQDDALSDTATAVVDVWRDAVAPAAAAREPDNRRQQPEIRGAFDAAQQWAYYILAKAGTDVVRRATEGPISEDWERAQGVLAAPVGRLRLPLKDYFTVSMVIQQAVRSGDEVASRDRAGAQDVVGKSLFNLYRILQYASENTYLWRRLLSPVPMFDLDTALLVARMQEASVLPGLDRIPRTNEHSVSEESTRYAREFIRTVELLRHEPGPGQENEPTPVPAPSAPESEGRAEQAISYG